MTAALHATPRARTTATVPRLEVVPGPSLGGRSLTTIYRAYTDPEDGSDDVFAPVVAVASELPEPGPFAASLVVSCLEVLAGARPVAQLARWLDHEIYLSLAQRAGIHAGHRHHSRQPVPARRAKVTIRRVRTCKVSDNVVEVSVVAAVDGQVKAVALRLEGLDRRWKVKALEIG